VTVALSEPVADLLGEELGDGAGAAERADGLFRQRLGFAYESLRRRLAAAHAAGRRLHVFLEPAVDGGRGAAGRAAACLAYEAIGNETYAGYGCELTCVWDARRHSAATIGRARRVHSHELQAGGRVPSARFMAPAQYLAGRGRPLRVPDRTDWDASLDGLAGLPALRRQVRDWAQAHRFAPHAAGDVILAVGEIATNGVVHGGPPVSVHGWRDGDTLVVQTDDHGGTPLPASAGYQPPGDGQAGHQGLWVARQLADVVQAHTAAGVTSVRLYFPHELTHRDA
jgi:anti-sigma regulatory factor (Ser/Thr protein kinase)